MALIKIGTATTGADGKINFPNLPYGTYQLVQNNAPEGYQVQANIPEITVDTTTPKEITCQNTPVKSGSLKIKKTALNYPLFTLPGAVYKLTDASDKVLKTASTTDASGEIVFDNLMTMETPVSYKVLETTAPTGFELDGTPVPASITEDQETLLNLTDAPTNAGELEATLSDATYSEYTMPGSEFDLFVVVQD